MNRAYSALRQKLRCSSSACRAVSRTVRLTRLPRRPRRLRRRRGFGGAGQLEVRLFQRRGHRQAFQVTQAVLDRPGQQDPKGQGRVGGMADRLRAAHRQAHPIGKRDLAAAHGGRRAEGDTGGQARPGRDLLGSPGQLDAARPQDGDPVGQPLRLVQVVGGEQDGLAQPAQVLDGRPASPPGLRVEAGSRLVQEHHVGVARQGQREVQPSPLPGRQLAHLGAAHLGELHHLEQVTERARRRVIGAPQVDQLGHPGLPGEAAFLQDHPGPLAQPGGRLRHRVQRPSTRTCPPATEALEDLQRGGLARAVRAEQAEDLAVADLERWTPCSTSVAPKLIRRSRTSTAAGLVTRRPSRPLKPAAARAARRRPPSPRPADTGWRRRPGWRTCAGVSASRSASPPA